LRKRSPIFPQSIKKAKFSRFQLQPMKRIIAPTLGLLSLMLAGCVSTANVALSKDRLSAAEGGTLTVSSRAMPDFVILKPSTAVISGLTGGVGGAIAGDIAVKKGDEFINANGIPDPAVKMKKELSAYLATTFHLTEKNDRPVVVSTNDEEEMANAAAGKADFLLDVQTVNWSFLYLPFDWSRYRLLYSVKLRLIDIKKKEMIAEGFYFWKTPGEAYNPTYDELIAKHGEAIQKQSDDARVAATKYFESNILTQ
jgi:hypothetical protein